ncbi:unnamed protein product, partial [Musa acuminata subsp. burmannicoides]
LGLLEREVCQRSDDLDGGDPGVARNVVELRFLLSSGGSSGCRVGGNGDAQAVLKVFEEAESLLEGEIGDQRAELLDLGGSCSGGGRRGKGEDAAREEGEGLGGEFDALGGGGKAGRRGPGGLGGDEGAGGRHTGGGWQRKLRQWNR